MTGPARAKLPVGAQRRAGRRWVPGRGSASGDPPPHGESRREPIPAPFAL